MVSALYYIYIVVLILIINNKILIIHTPPHHTHTHKTSIILNFTCCCCFYDYQGTNYNSSLSYSFFHNRFDNTINIPSSYKISIQAKNKHRI